MPLVQKPAEAIYVGDAGHKPRCDNGEYDISQVLDHLGIEFLFEALFYPIRLNSAGKPTHGFTPDFWLPATTKRLACHIEVTWPDKPNNHPGRNKGRSIDEVIRSKQHKICTIFRIYEVPTLLLDYRACCALNENQRQLTELIAMLYATKQDQNGFFYPTKRHFD